MRPRHLIAAILAVAPALAGAAETTTYDYDAKGRLVTVRHAGGPANGVASAYSFDAADNRTSTTVTGAQLNASGRGVVVVHVGRWKIIPLPNL